MIDQALVRGCQVRDWMHLRHHNAIRIQSIIRMGLVKVWIAANHDDLEAEKARMRSIYDLYRRYVTSLL